ncbi:G-type lectin S-receptor-like serine/threonine-protein kinase [Vitis vinifera]|uniref:G-type lectin S-receptor-like serine/threonine-protein kinase n=1 Tax=Vitis vinifera TaxID=29760 RepID=A0A438G952_VITVI|nr:G-type lectin S-receptor-like serine/threonine-protein kinase [Vitis vinifera]
MNALRTVVFVFSYVFSLIRISIAVDTITVNQHIRDGETITSAGGTFELGFFSPGNSKNRYLGIWYKKVAPRTVVWVANRESPLTDSSGVLKVTQQGILVLVNDTSGILWNSNSSRSALDPNAQLLESGNLVMRNGNDSDPENFLWQSFDYLGDTLLPGMKLGRNRVTGLDWYLSSWKSADDPSKGNFTCEIDLNGFPQLVLRNGFVINFRAGPWNGVRYSGIPQLTNNSVYTFNFVSNEKELKWTDKNTGWTLYSTAQRDDCDNYAFCGAYGICKIDQSPKCECMKGFRPKFQSKWDEADWSHGCVPNTPLDCQKGDGFAKFSDVKLPDTQTSWFNVSMNLKECASLCLRKCTCTAYANSDIRGGGSGCLLWLGDLIDIREFTQNGQEFYVRMATSELGYIEHNSKGGETNEGWKHLELSLFDLDTLLNATNNFSSDNKLGEGGFGLVYKGKLQEGQEIAVKMMSKTSRQGLKEFKNEVESIAKLQHQNLVKLLGYFGIARSFGGNETEANNKSGWNIWLYVSEYASEGLYSTKSDVFSFGVLVLEIISRKRNRGFNTSQTLELNPSWACMDTLYRRYAIFATAFCMDGDGYS